MNHFFPFHLSKLRLNCHKLQAIQTIKCQEFTLFDLLSSLVVNLLQVSKEIAGSCCFADTFYPLYGIKPTIYKQATNLAK